MTQQFQIEERAPQPTLAVRARTQVQSLPAFFEKVFGASLQRLGELGQQPAGPPFAIYYNQDMNDLDIEAGFPVTEPVEGNEEITSGMLPGGKMVTGIHLGPYEQVAESWEAISIFAEEQGFETETYGIEFYLNDPTTVPPEEIQTQIVLPIKQS